MHVFPVIVCIQKHAIIAMQMTCNQTKLLCNAIYSVYTQLHISIVIFVCINTHVTLWKHVSTVRPSSSGQERTHLRYNKVRTQWDPISFTVKVKLANDELLFETETKTKFC
jgi:hypothetical protein